MRKVSFNNLVYQHIKAKVKSKPTRKSQTVLQRHQAELARIIYSDLARHVDAYHRRGDGTYLQRLKHLDEHPEKAFAFMWDMDEVSAVTKVLDKMLEDGFEPEQDFKQLLNYCHCLWLYYQHPLPGTLVAEKMALALAKVVRMGTIAVLGINRIGKDRSRTDKSGRIKRSRRDKCRDLVREVLSRLGILTVPEKGLYPLADRIIAKWPIKDTPAPRTIVNLLREIGKM